MVTKYNRERYIANASNYAEFYKKESRIPSATIEEEKKIASWRFNQIKELKSGVLSDEKKQILYEVCPFIFDSIRNNPSWKTRYDQLHKFITDNIRLPTHSFQTDYEAQLARWMHYNVKLYKTGKLDKQRAEKLAMIVPDLLGRSEEEGESVLNQIKSRSDIQKYLDITDRQLVELLKLKILNTDTLSKLIECRMDRVLSVSDSDIADKAMDILGVYIESESNDALLNSPPGKGRKVEARLNELIYGIDYGKLYLASAILGRVSREDSKEVFRNTEVYLEVILKTLNSRRAEVIRQRYLGHKTLEQVGKTIGITSKERVRQLESKALRELRHPSRAGILKGTRSHRALYMIATREQLNRILVTCKDKDTLNLIEIIVDDIREKYQINKPTSFILGLVQLGLFDTNKNRAEGDGKDNGKDNGEVNYTKLIDRLEQIKLEHTREYIDIFEQGVGIGGSEGEKPDRSINIILQALENMKAQDGEDKDQADETKALDKYSIQLENMGLSVRAYNCLYRSNLTNLSLIADAINDGSISRVRNLGAKTLKEILDRVEELT